jgi:hypothetical protein
VENWLLTRIAQSGGLAPLMLIAMMLSLYLYKGSEFPGPLAVAVVATFFLCVLWWFSAVLISIVYTCWTSTRRTGLIALSLNFAGLLPVIIYDVVFRNLSP